ncbi:hypothetical protein SCLCIDRAFT_19378 [Scleroderma citrinum Foug A]|uniref:F-box domain-containing protein n=1 Tax=Scleroderma citrinum Foug A TaxID=1036808 RepID=A0A0C3ENT0_9AGAM|nr:hypothetical protein SCLCIDRAFT_19378 [Scleroderma citrinum Foug A]
MAPNGTGRSYAGPTELTPDVWIVVMSYLSTSDLVVLGKTCTTLRRYSQLRHVWFNALRKHRFLSASYPHLLNAPSEVIRRQLITTAYLDAAYSQPSLVPIQTYSFPLEFQGMFQGLRWLPGGDWLVLLFHSRTLNPERHSNLWLFKPCITKGVSTSVPPTVSASLQSEWCWLPITEQDGPYLSSRGDNLLLLHTYAQNVCTFGICTLDTTKPSVDVKLTVQTSVFIRNYVAVGDYFVYGWTAIKPDGSERRHLVRIMKLNENYSGFSQDVTVEINCPPGHSGKLRIKYDLRLAGEVPRLLLVSARLMAAYNIPNNSSSSASDSVLCLRPVWKHVPEEGRLSFGRILRVFTEGAIVTLRDGKTRYIVPEIHSSNRQMNSQTTAVYSFLQHKQENLSWSAVFDSQRAFWPVRISLPSSRSSEQVSPCRTERLSASTGVRTTIETALIPPPCNESGGECVIRRLPIDYECSTEEHSHLSSPLNHQTYAHATRKPITAIVQDWDELSGRLCVRHLKGVNYTRGQGLAQTSVRIVVIHMV